MGVRPFRGAAVGRSRKDRDFLHDWLESASAEQMSPSEITNHHKCDDIISSDSIRSLRRNSLRGLSVVVVFFDFYESPRHLMLAICK